MLSRDCRDSVRTAASCDFENFRVQGSVGIAALIPGKASIARISSKQAVQHCSSSRDDDRFKKWVCSAAKTSSISLLARDNGVIDWCWTLAPCCFSSACQALIALNDTSRYAAAAAAVELPWKSGFNRIVNYYWPYFCLCRRGWWYGVCNERDPYVLVKAILIGVFSSAKHEIIFPLIDGNCSLFGRG